jgi:Ser-tRNA(Ala) deacylase AlaX
LSILAGLILGLSMADHQARIVLDLSKCTEKYEASLQELSKENLLMLHQFISSVMAHLKKVPSE